MHNLCKKWRNILSSRVLQNNRPGFQVLKSWIFLHKFCVFGYTKIGIPMMNAPCRLGSNGPPLHQFPANKVLQHWLKHKHRLALKRNRNSQDNIVVSRIWKVEEQAYTSTLCIWIFIWICSRSKAEKHIFIILIFYLDTMYMRSITVSLWHILWV